MKENVYQGVFLNRILLKVYKYLSIIELIIFKGGHQNSQSPDSALFPIICVDEKTRRNN